MKKLLVLVTMCLLIVSSIIASAQQQEQSTTQTLDSNDGIISICIPVGTATYQKTPEGDEIALDGFGRHLIPGKPDLPSKIFSIAIPPGAVVVDFRYTIGEGLVLPGRYDIKPVPLPQVNGQGNQEIQVHEEQLFAENYQMTYSL